LEECASSDADFLEIIKELCDKSIWLAVTTRDLYYWIDVLNKVDSIMANIIRDIRELADGTQRCSQEDYKQMHKEKCTMLKTLLTFTNNLLRESSSRTIYNSVDVS